MADGDGPWLVMAVLGGGCDWWSWPIVGAGLWQQL